MPLQRTPSSIQGLLLLLDGRLVEARRPSGVGMPACDRARRRKRHRLLSLLAGVAGNQAGDLQAAQARADQALLVATLTGSTSIRAFALACRATVSALRGDIELARRDCDDASCLAEQTANAIAMRMIAYARCLLELSVGRRRGGMAGCRTVAGATCARPRSMGAARTPVPTGCARCADRAWRARPRGDAAGCLPGSRTCAGSGVGGGDGRAMPRAVAGGPR